MLPVVVQLPVAGLYSAALASGPEPPATRTWPLGSRVALGSYRAVCRLPVVVQLPVAGLYSSALVPPPPATSTCPLGSRVAVESARATCRLPVNVQVPEPAARVGTAGSTVSAPRTSSTGMSKSWVSLQVHRFIGKHSFAWCIVTTDKRTTRAPSPHVCSSWAVR